MHMNLFGYDINIRRRANLEVTHDLDGNWHYMFPVSPFGGETKKYLEWALTNPVLFAVMFTRAKLYSQMKITAEDVKTGDEVDVPELKLLAKPNYFQSQQDWLFQQSWFLSGSGNNLIYQIRPFSSEMPKAIYNLVPSEIDYKQVMRIKKFISSKQDIADFEKQEIVYKLDSQEYRLKIKDIIPLYDVTNGLTRNGIIQSPCRVEAIKKNLINIEENMKAANVNLQMSQKYIARNKNSIQGAPSLIHDDDRKAIESALWGKSLQITNGDIEVQHLVEDLKKLYLSEQFASEAAIIANAFEMNRDVINYALSGSTYENQEHGIIRYIQSAIQSDADNTMNSLTNSWGLDEKGIKLKGSYNHLPIMQTLVKARVETLQVLSNTLKTNVEAQIISIEDAKDQYNKTKKELGL